MPLRPGIRTRERAYAASAASAVTPTIEPTARYTEFSRDENAYGFSESFRKLSSVQSGQLTLSPGLESNGAVTSHSMGSAQNAMTTARNATSTRRPTIDRGLLGLRGRAGPWSLCSVRVLIGAPAADGRRTAR